MAEYIEREAAINKIMGSLVNQDCHDVRLHNIGLRKAMSTINTLPAADVVEVVRCRDCEYGEHTGLEYICRTHSGHADKLGEDAQYTEYHSVAWFCADGVPRGEASP